MGIEGDDLLSEAEALLPDAITLRRTLHTHPELGLELPETRKTVLAALASLDLQIELCQKSSGIIATLRGGKPGPIILLRADMDALPMQENTGLSYSSQNEGSMHACGHDAHTAMLVGAASLLARRRFSLQGTVKFFFQPGEEGHFGAKRMLEEGLLEGVAEPDAAFALHIDPRMHRGHVASRRGPVMASADVWRVEFTGRGGHASMPHSALDPIPAACELVGSLQTMVTRRISAFDPVVLTTTKIEAGTTNNVIPETSLIVGTLRSISEHSRMAGEEGIHRVAQGIASAHGLSARVDVISGYPVTENDPAFADFAKQVATDLLGEERYRAIPTPIMGSEDFCYLLQRWPGAMFFLGLRSKGARSPQPCHSNRMTIGEEGMIEGIALHSAVALSYLSGHSDEA